MRCLRWSKPGSSLRERPARTSPLLRQITASGDTSFIRPLAALRGLERLSLIGLKPADRSLAPVTTLVGLKELDVQLQFPLEELALVAAKLPNAKHAIAAHTSFRGLGTCRRCGGVDLVVTSGDRRRTLCVSCDADRIREVERRFDELVVGALLASASSGLRLVG